MIWSQQQQWHMKVNWCLIATDLIQSLCLPTPHCLWETIFLHLSSHLDQSLFLLLLAYHPFSLSAPSTERLCLDMEIACIYSQHFRFVCLFRHYLLPESQEEPLTCLFGNHVSLPNIWKSLCPLFRHQLCQRKMGVKERKKKGVISFPSGGTQSFNCVTTTESSLSSPGPLAGEAQGCGGWTHPSACMPALCSLAWSLPSHFFNLPCPQVPHS